jgi:hypothetical protein
MNEPDLYKDPLCPPTLVMFFILHSHFQLHWTCKIRITYLDIELITRNMTSIINNIFIIHDNTLRYVNTFTEVKWQ